MYIYIYNFFMLDSKPLRAVKKNPDEFQNQIIMSTEVK